MRYFMPPMFIQIMLLALVGVGCGPPTVGLDELGMRTVKLPNGQQIRAEAEISNRHGITSCDYRSTASNMAASVFV